MDDARPRSWRGELGRRQGKKPSAIQVSEKKINEGIESRDGWKIKAIGQKI